MALLTKNQIDEVRATKGIKEQLDVLKSYASGKRCFILGCGPSLTDITPEQLAEASDGALVIALKQAFAYAPTACDVLVLNSWNYQRYDYDQRQPLIIRETAQGDPAVFGEVDMQFDISRPSELSEQLARKKNFSDFTFDKTLLRPWGPGVLYEVGFYVAEYCAVSDLVMIGWDVGVKGSAIMPHFYETVDPVKTQALMKSRSIADPSARNKFLHDNGVLYNKPRIIPEEVDACADVSGDWYDWLKGRGIDMTIVSQHSLASDRIPRSELG